MLNKDMKKAPLDIFSGKEIMRRQCKELIRECFFKIKDINEYYVFEDLIQHILRIGYNCDVINLNRRQNNHPAVDLQYNTIMFQVTVDTSESKINETIEKFFENKLNKKNSKLIIISEYNSSYGSYKYCNTQVEILSVEELIDEIFKLSKIKISSIHPNFDNYLLKEIKDCLFRLDTIEKYRTQEFNPYI